MSEIDQYRNEKGLPVVSMAKIPRGNGDSLIVKDFISQPLQSSSRSIPNETPPAIQETTEAIATTREDIKDSNNITSPSEIKNDTLGKDTTDILPPDEVTIVPGETLETPEKTPPATNTPPLGSVPPQVKQPSQQTPHQVSGQNPERNFTPISPTPPTSPPPPTPPIPPNIPGQTYPPVDRQIPPQYDPYKPPRGQYMPHPQPGHYDPNIAGYPHDPSFSGQFSGQTDQGQFAGQPGQFPYQHPGQYPPNFYQDPALTVHGGIDPYLPSSLQSSENNTASFDDTPYSPGQPGVPHYVDIPGLSDLPQDTSFFDEHTTIIDTKTKKDPPEIGGRAFVKKIFPFLNIGKGKAERDTDEISDSITKPLDNTKKIGVMSLSGGSGATVSAVVIASIYSSRKGSRGIVSLDLNKDGNLGDRISDNKAASNITMVARNPEIVTAAQINSACAYNKDGVKVLASQRNPDYSSLTPADYDTLVRKLTPHYELILVDIPHNFNDPLLPSVLSSLDGLFICTTTATDHIKNMEILISKIRHPRIVAVPPKIVVVMGHHVKGKPKARITGVMGHLFSDKKIPAAALIPFDEHIDEGGAIRYDALAKKTQYQYRKCAAHMLDLIPSR